MADIHPLLELQRVDSDADALRAQREALPERALLRDGESEGAALAEQRAAAEARLAALAHEERRIEADVADARAKAREIEESLYSGRVSAVKELEALQAELRAFQQRQRDHEEAELALMEQEEQLAAGIAALDARRDALSGGATGWRAALAASEAAIDAELGELASARAAVVAQLPPATVAAYEKLRAVARFKGRVVARIEGETCNGCWGGLPIAFVSRFARESVGTTTECPRCGRLLLH